MFPLDVEAEDEVRARTLFIEACHSDGSIEYGSFEAAEGFLPGFHGFEALCAYSFALTVVSEFDLDGITLAR